MTTIFILAQAIGLIATAIDIYATTRKTDKALVQLHALGSALFSVHYFMLGAIPGALSEILNATRTGLSSFTQSKILAYIFLTLYVALLFLVPDNLIGTFPFLCGILVTVGLYFFKGIKMRLFYIAGFALWLAYTISVMSWGGILVFSLLLISTSRTVYQMMKDKA